MGSKHTTLMLDAGSNIVGGVNARKAGTTVELGGQELPVFGSVKEAMAETGADVSVVFVPPAFTKDACIEAIDAGIGLLVVITEGVPVQDTAEVWAYLEGKSTRMIGPNCPGIITPGESLAGITPHTIAGKGPIGLVSKSGTLTYQMMYELRDFGFSTAIGIGGDPVVGTTHIDALAAFEADPDTKAIVMIGEIGGDAEERAAAYIKDHVTKPVVGYVAGFTAPEGKTMGHAGAIVSGSSGTAAGQEGGPRGRRRQGRQDAVRDRRADAGDPADALSRGTPIRLRLASGETRSDPQTNRCPPPLRTRFVHVVEGRLGDPAEPGEAGVGDDLADGGLAGLGAERVAAGLRHRVGHAEERREAVEHPADRVQVRLDGVAGGGLDDQPRTVRGQANAGCAGPRPSGSPMSCRQSNVVTRSRPRGLELLGAGHVERAPGRRPRRPRPARGRTRWSPSW